MIGTSLTIIALLAVAGLAWLSGSPRPVAPRPAERAVVIEFANRTGNPELAALGLLAAESLTDGLASLRLVEVLPAIPLERDGGTDPQRVAAESHAGVVISGALSTQGDGLRIRCNVLDPRREEVVYGVEAYSASATDPAEAIGEIRERVMGLFAMSFDTAHQSFLGQLPPHGRLWTLSRPPRYSAYREYATALGFHGVDWERQLEHLERSGRIDPDFFEVGLFQATVLGILGERDKQGQVLEHWEGRRDELSDYQRCRLDWIRADRDRNTAEKLRQMQQALALNPGDALCTYNAALHALELNRPRLAVEMFGGEPPDVVQAFAWRAAILADAHHLLGEFERELQIAGKSARRFPGDLGAWYRQAQALAALGRVDELEALLDRSESFSGRGSPGHLMRTAALELRAHGDPDTASRVARRAVEWFERRDPQEAASLQGRRSLAEALYLAGEWSAAHELFDRLSAESPEDPWLLAARGLSAARTGDMAGARSVSRQIADLHDPSGPGHHTYNRACIAAILGEKERAVTLLREALGQGLSFGLFVHRDIDLEPLRGYAPYEELTRPK